MEDIRSLKKCLEKIITNSDKVFIVGHTDPDFDAIGSSIGIQALASYLNRESYIVVDDKELEPGVKKIKEEFQKKNHIITLDDYNNIKGFNTSLIMTDVNKDYMISLQDYLNDFKNIIIIDHHNEDAHTVKTDKKYINPDKSSASEIVANVLFGYREGIIDSKLANLLLAGIVLDTKRFSLNTSAKTHDIVEKLIKKGASIEHVNDLFLREFEEDKKINSLVFSNTMFRNFQSEQFQNRNIAFTLNREEPKKIYKKEELAKASDKLLKYKVDAAFVLGYINPETISVSGRSKSDVDVSKILSSIDNVQGGGNRYTAGAKTKELELQELEKKIIERTTEYLTEREENQFVLKKTKKY